LHQIWQSAAVSFFTSIRQGGRHGKQKIYTGENYSRVFRRHLIKSLFRFAKASRQSSEGRGGSEAPVELPRKAPDRLSPSEKSDEGGLSFLNLAVRLPDDTLALVFQHQFSLAGSNRFLRADAKVHLRTSPRDFYCARSSPNMLAMVERLASDLAKSRPNYVIPVILASCPLNDFELRPPRSLLTYSYRLPIKPLILKMLPHVLESQGCDRAARLRYPAVVGRALEPIRASVRPAQVCRAPRL